MPLAPPPLSTSPTVGRLSCGGWAQATGAHSTASNARVIASRFTGGRYRGSAVLFVIVSKGKVGYIRYHRFRHYAVNTEVCTRGGQAPVRSEEHTSELQSRPHLVCRLLLEKKNWLSGKFQHARGMIAFL